jgi:hypothetical protein
MSPILKKSVAATVVGAAAVVWFARLGGYDPLGVTDGASSTTAEASAQPHDFGDAWIAATADPADQSVGTDAVGAEGGAASLGAVIGFLEHRHVDGSAAAVADHTLEAARALGGDQPKSRLEVDALLVQYPLRALAIGSRRATALLGRHQVATGDTLAGGNLRVVAIDRTGVVLDTPNGRVTLTVDSTAPVPANPTNPASAPSTQSAD